jgi:hypothetical protein
MFIVGVLAFIAIGVGVVAVTTNQKVYGPPGARFTVTFPGRVYEPLIRLHGPDADMDYVSNGPYTGRPSNESNIEDSVDAEFISNGVSPYDLRELVLKARSVDFPFAPRESTEQVNGFLLTRLGPLCDDFFCEEVLIVMHNRAIWVLSSTAGGKDLFAWRYFLDSFEPIG